MSHRYNRPAGAEAKGLLNAANLHVGGGVQVAASVFSELASLEEAGAGFNAIVSTRVAQEVGAVKWRSAAFNHLVSDVFGLRLRDLLGWRALDGYPAVFTIFGPLYRWRPPFRSIVGFAQSWIINPDNICYARLPLAQRVKARLKYNIQSMFFKRADVLVVELEHVKEGLIRELGIPPDRIHVVHNCLASIYHDKAAWQPVLIPPVDCDLRLGFVGRNYIHKNTIIFPEIAKALRERHGIEARFYVTFTDTEWAACDPVFREFCINVGALSVAQCPSFYQSLDAVVFPSLLECFSATPFEAMAMEKPLFASDLPFNTEICGRHAHYFDPLDPQAAAERIAEVFGGNGPDACALRAGRDHAINFSNPGDRAAKIVALLKSEVEIARKTER